jgi:hypothetical protein
LPCHTSKGFIEVKKTSTLDVLGNVVTNITRGTLNEGITCAACHTGRRACFYRIVTSSGLRKD